MQKKTFTPDYLTHAKKYNHGEEAMVVLKNHHEPLINRELWDIVQEEIKKRNRNGGGGAGHSNRYVFSGKIRCGECSASFVSRKKTCRDGSSYRRWSCCTAAAEGRRHVDVQGNELGCDIGRTIRDEQALEILKQSLRTIKMDHKQIINNVTQIAIEAIRAEAQEGHGAAGKLEQEIESLMQKKVDVLDAFISQKLSPKDMELINERYDRELEAQRTRLGTIRAKEGAVSETAAEDIRKQVAAIISGSTGSESFYKNILDRMVVYRDHRVEVCLNHLPQKWIYILERVHFEPTVPISVNNPFSSG